MKERLAQNGIRGKLVGRFDLSPCETPKHRGPALGRAGRASWIAATEFRLISLITASVATLGAIVLGTGGALAARHLRGWLRRFMDGIHVSPITLPTVTVGLALLVAFSRPPLLLNGTPELVIMVHIILITAYTYNCIRAGLARLPEAYEQVAASLGGSPAYILRRVTLPLLRPYLAAAASLSFAFSRASWVQPSWSTLPAG